MTITLPPLPYAQDALSPYISANTLQFHHGKHHNAYVTKLNELIKGTPLENKSLEEIIMASFQNTSMIAIFNNAAQVWNHTFYWHCMKPNGGGLPQGRLAEAIKHHFGSVEECIKQLKEAAVTQFGSGWAWLVYYQGKLEVMKTGNADLPMVHGKTALLAIDVWEHAYYLDFQNRRPDYVTIFFDKLIHWDHVQTCFQQAAS